jgi:calcineurin-like phosphoesterase family protein
MTDVWFTSDLHIGHPLVASIRGFDHVGDHNDTLASRWDRVVQTEDDVWVLGDAIMGDKAGGLWWFRSRPGTKHLVLGNHDRAHPMHNNAHAHIDLYREAFTTVQTMARVSIADGEEKVNLSHFPYEGDRNEERFWEWRLRETQRTLLHGHTHLPDRFSRTKRGTLQVHVGVDAWDLRPVRRFDVWSLVQSLS